MKCERCNKEHDGSFGSGRFCSRVCSNSRNHAQETKDKISRALTKVRRFCSKCGNPLGYNNKSGLCKKCRPPAKTKSAIISEHRRQRKRDLVAYKGGKCEKCGYDKCIGALEFHHKDPNGKDFGISKEGTTKSLERDKAEVDKCILVCANCHRELHEQIYNDSVAQLVRAPDCELLAHDDSNVIMNAGEFGEPPDRNIEATPSQAG